MPLFKDLYEKAREKVDSGSRTAPSSSSNPPAPPPIPYSSKPSHGTATSPASASAPNSAAVRAPYWNPGFEPHLAVSQYFQQETGQHGWGNNEAQNYTTASINSFFTANQQLVVRAIAKSRAATQQERFTSARLISHQKLSRQSGMLSVQLTAPCARGVWPAVWLLPAQPSKWPDDGEIDVFEAWDGDPVNHSCLHWGSYEGRDLNKHRVLETHIPDLTSAKGKEYSLVWRQNEKGKSGKCIWYIDGVPVMKATVPDSTMRLSEWQLIINVAMGGNVCKGRIPEDGTYDLVIHRIEMFEEPLRGWTSFDIDWKKTKEGHPL